MHTRFAGLAVVCAGLGITFLGHPAVAQTTVHTQAVEITLTGRLHTQINTTSVATEPGDQILIRRARFSVAVKINDFVSGLVEPEYAGSKAQLKVAYLRLAFAPAFNATIGQYKRPFDLFTVTSSADILVIERTGDIRGVDTCTGVGGICSFNQFLEQLQYSATDIGIVLDGHDRASRVTYAVAVMNGPGPNLADENGTKSYSGRLTVAATPNVHVGGNVAVHDYVNPVRGNAYAPAFEGDLEIGNFARGFHLQAGAVGGDNWRALVAGEPRHFLALQAIATYRVAVHRPPYAEAIEPVARVSWGNPDTATPRDGGVLLTPGIVWHIAGRNKIGANVDVWHPQQGATEWSLKVQSYLFF
jgi:Phosphate-selective porin O and P